MKNLTKEEQIRKLQKEIYVRISKLRKLTKRNGCNSNEYSFVCLRNWDIVTDFDSKKKIFKEQEKEFKYKGNPSRVYDEND